MCVRVCVCDCMKMMQPNLSDEINVLKVEQQDYEPPRELYLRTLAVPDEEPPRESYLEKLAVLNEENQISSTTQHQGGSFIQHVNMVPCLRAE